jgi:hypothetical protein
MLGSIWLVLVIIVACCHSRPVSAKKSATHATMFLRIARILAPPLMPIQSSSPACPYETLNAFVVVTPVLEPRAEIVATPAAAFLGTTTLFEKLPLVFAVTLGRTVFMEASLKISVTSSPRRKPLPLTATCGRVFRI